MSKIEWTDLTWNPVTGCDKVSQGCKNCYAEKMHKRLLAIAPHKYTKPFLGNIELHPAELRKPIDKKQPTMWFVNSMSDLFHHDVPFDFIDNVFAVMDCCPQHTFQILTKRPDRMLKYLREDRSWRVGQLKVSYDSSDYNLSGWPLKNVLLGTSAEDQDCYNKRITAMWFVRQLGWRTMLSAEPLIGPIRLYVAPGDLAENTFSWIIAGGESGPKARPMHPDWVRSLRDQCKRANVPFFFKQWGEYLPFEPTSQPPFYRAVSTRIEYDGHGMNMIDPETGDAGKFKGFRWYDPLDAITLCLEENSSDCQFLKVGKSNSGNLIDRKLHLEFPKAI